MRNAMLTILLVAVILPATACEAVEPPATPPAVKEADVNSSASSVLPEPLRGVKRIVFYGDSLTDGSSYPDYVVSTLNGVFDEADFEVQNAAICGDTCGNLLKRLQRDLLPLDGDLVSICIGTNDCINKVPVDEFREQLEELVSAIETAGSKVVLFLPSHFGDKAEKKFPGIRERFKAYLAVIREVAAEHNLPLVDAYDHFVAQEKAGKEMLNTFDGIHHGENGFEGMARAFLDAMGLTDVPVDTTVRPWACVLSDWEISAPGTIDPNQAGGWKPLDKAKAVEVLPWWDSPFIERGAWMPFVDGTCQPDAKVLGRVVYNAPAAGKAELQVGGSSPMIVYLNGREVWQGEGRFGVHPNGRRTVVDLVKGKNELVVRSTYIAFVGLRPLP